MTRKKYVEGVDRVSRVFKALPRESVEEIAHALNLGAKEVADAAKLLAPVGDYKGGGDLKQDIQVDTTKLEVRHDNRSVLVRVIVGTRRAIAHRAFRQEFGRAPSDGHPGHAPQSFFFTAYHAKRKRVRSRVARAVNKAAKAMARVR